MPTQRETQNHQDIVTLRDLLNERTEKLTLLVESVAAIEKEKHAAIDAKLAASQEVLKERLYALNELRGDVITKTEYLAQHESLAKEFHAAVDVFQTQISNLKEWRAEIIPILAQVQEIGQLKDWRAEQRGKASTTSVTGAYVVAILGWLLGPLIALAIERIAK